jgi:hypothetical protein
LAQKDIHPRRRKARAAELIGIHVDECMVYPSPSPDVVSWLVENPAAWEQTITTLVGHVSKSMLARYSHIRIAAEQAAIDALEAG